jgi:predicted ATP-dependent Lon-type protease
MSFKSVHPISWLQKRVEYDSEYLPTLLGQSVYNMLIDEFDLDNNRTHDWEIARYIYEYFEDIYIKMNTDRITQEYSKRFLNTIKAGYLADNPVDAVKHKRFPNNTKHWFIEKSAEYVKNIMTEQNYASFESKYAKALESTPTYKYNSVLNSYIWNDIHDLSKHSSHKETKEFATKLIKFLNMTWEEEKLAFIAE